MREKVQQFLNAALTGNLKDFKSKFLILTEVLMIKGFLFAFIVHLGFSLT